MLDRPAEKAEALDEYDREVDRYYRVNGTLVHLFYFAKIDWQKFEDPAYMWKAIEWAGWSYRLKFLYWGMRLAFKDEETRRRMGEEVVFGNPRPGNLVAKQFLMLSRNFDKVYEKEIRAAERRVQPAGPGLDRLAARGAASASGCRPGRRRRGSADRQVPAGGVRGAGGGSGGVSGARALRVRTRAGRRP